MLLENTLCATSHGMSLTEQVHLFTTMSLAQGCGDPDLRTTPDVNLLFSQ